MVKREPTCAGVARPSMTSTMAFSSPSTSNANEEEGEQAEANAFKIAFIERRR
jgi:hypothetical protein